MRICSKAPRTSPAAASPKILRVSCRKDWARGSIGSWPVLPIFELLRKLGRIPEDDWRRTFNLGIGMIFVVSQRAACEAAKILDK